MPRLIESILEHVTRLPEGTPIAANELLHLGSRMAVDQALSRLVRREQLLRVERGLYVRPVETRFGTRPPSVEKTMDAVARVKGIVIASHGAAVANALGLTTQVPARTVYLTSGTSRQLKLGGHNIELRHAPKWQFVMVGHLAGDVVRALAWMGPAQARKALQTLKRTISASDLEELISARAQLPTWMATLVSTLMKSG